jgi:hypothetical protein
MQNWRDADLNKRCRVFNKADTFKTVWHFLDAAEACGAFDATHTECMRVSLEITPDPLMTRTSEFLLTLTRNACDVSEVFREIVLQAWRDRRRSVCSAPIERKQGRLVHS